MPQMFTLDLSRLADGRIVFTQPSDPDTQSISQNKIVLHPDQIPTVIEWLKQLSGGADGAR